MCFTHTPLPLQAFTFPLLWQAPSVYIFISGTLIAAPCPCSRSVGMLDSWSGVVKIWKHSARLFLLVINGSNRIDPLLAFAILLVTILLLVSDKFPCLSLWSRLSFGAIKFSLFRASSAHVCGCWHPPHLSQTQSQHMQVRFS